ncbi:MAG: helix-turn-helix domain-containing protein [Verrucomicrobium sp.]|nr:helix-turn-helix domain-containing protein [Verrucomicrobium sp.]
MKASKRMEEAKRLCESLSEAEEAMTRELLARLSDKWSLWALGVLAEAGGPIRFTRVMERVGGISQKSLTKALRQLERDGLATRKLFPEVPPRVEYAITPLGMKLLEQVEPLWSWIAGQVRTFTAARKSFDARRAPARAAR